VPDSGFFIAYSDLQLALPTLLPELLENFASRKSFVIHDDVLPCLQDLQQSNLKLGIISNSDPGTMKVVESLGIVPEYVSPEQ
jgi:FMN phosphatase YigB (HAD superfamily)